MEWPPDFSGELDRRLKLEHRLTAEPALLNGALLRLCRGPGRLHLATASIIYEPRNANAGEPVMLPVVLFQRQREFIAWLHERFTTKTSAPVEKSTRQRRDVDVGCAFAVWVWLFHPG